MQLSALRRAAKHSLHHPFVREHLCSFHHSGGRSTTSNNTPLGNDSCGVQHLSGEQMWRQLHTLDQINTLQQQPPRRRQLRSFQHSGSWSRTSNSTPLGDDSCAVSNTQEVGQEPPTTPLWETTVAQFPPLRRLVKNLQKHPSGRRKLCSFQQHV